MKTERHGKILELISRYEVETQEELADLLVKEGFKVTQATVSRDIRDLKLSKVAAGNGKQRYVAVSRAESGMNDKYINVLRDGYVSMDVAQNLLVIKTVPGMAMAAAAALDAICLPEMVGCIAGDDVIMCAIRTSQEALNVMQKLRRMLEEK